MLHMLDYAVNEIRKRKKSYVLNILVISLVVVLLVTLNGLGAAYKDASQLPFENIHSSITIQKSGNVSDEHDWCPPPMLSGGDKLSERQEHQRLKWRERRF